MHELMSDYDVLEEQLIKNRHKLKRSIIEENNDERPEFRQDKGDGWTE